MDSFQHWDARVAFYRRSGTITTFAVVFKPANLFQQLQVPPHLSRNPGLLPFMATNKTPDGTKSTCPATGVKYLIKYATGSPTATATSGTPAPTGTGAPFSGKGFLQAYTSGANKGCLIGAGTWYTTGTCAGYTATASGSGFTLKSSKGDCGIVNSIFTCAAGVAASTFTVCYHPTSPIDMQLYAVHNSSFKY